ncbi:acyltransferase family protein [Ewingella americana]|uniref:acyltransferase family protein n=1 Tax=Ewingella americana TaxID=41202 RepID=UPI0012AD2465|nr:acyltransferase [Ewingella americana]MRT05092.1 acyltransferase family protein [Ewingella americana]
MKNKKIPAADGVRGFALMIVVLMHATGLFFPSLHDRLGGTAQPGVWLFFILSSFLLTYKFLSNGFSLPILTSYFLGRVIRIIPIFYIAVFIYFLLGLFDFNKFKEIVFFNGTYVHFWTIPVEFKFYFSLPLIVFSAVMVEKFFNAKISISFLIFLTLIISFSFPFTDEKLNGTMLVYTPVFMYGIIIAFIYAYTPIKINNPIADFLSLIIIAIFILMTPIFTGINGWLGDKFVVLGPLIAIFIYLQAISDGIVAKTFSSRGFANLGKFSFSIYLFHIMILFMIYPQYLNNKMAYLASIALSIGGGMLCYYLFESPLEKIRHLIMRKINKSSYFKNQSE